MKIVDPDVESDDQVLLKVVPDVDRDGGRRKMTI